MSPLRSLWRRLVQLNATHGTSAMITLVPLIVWQAVFGDGRNRRWPDPDGAAFDAAHGVETRGIISISALDAAEPNWVYGFDYQPVEVLDFATLLAPLCVDYPATTFVDLGAGKGRALMLAAALPFERLVGVEISTTLARAAAANLRRFERANDCAGRWEIVRSDASDYPFPDEPLVVFMYNPFTTPIMRRIIDKLCRARDTRARRILVIYVRPELDELWRNAPGFATVASTPRYRIYESR